MNKLYHFGDSYANVKYVDSNKHFVHHMADIVGLEYISKGIGGYSNEMIFRSILHNLFLYNSGDVIFINFSFFCRGSYYDKNDKIIKSTNVLYNEVYDNKIYNKKLYKKEILNEGVIQLVEYYLTYTMDYNIRLFALIDSILNYLTLKNILVYYIFIDKAEYSDQLISCGTNIQFEDGFFKWLQKNNFHNEEDIHYTVGIQPMLSDVILRKTNYLSKDCSKKIKIDIEDLDYSKILKPTKLL